jgi:hypothetical protein
MSVQTQPHIDVPSSLLEAIRTFPRQRDVNHCGSKLSVSPFDFYATCPRCGSQIKLRSFTAGGEIEDVFDAVFEWLLQPGAADLVRRRQEALAADQDE